MTSEKGLWTYAEAAESEGVEGTCYSEEEKLYEA